jgi:FixJ family two-component response regulator
MRDEQSVVFVIDDDPSIRDTMEDLLQSVGLAVRVFESPQEFLATERPDAPACLVLDVRLPGQSGLDFQRQLAASRIDLPIVFISGHGDVPMVAQAMKAGAIEFLSKPFRDQSLLDAIQAGIARDRIRRREAVVLADLRTRLDSLTEREREIMALVVSGLMNKEVAAALQVSEVTVKVHRGHLMHKMRAKSLPELVRMADRLCLGIRQP